MKLDEVFNILKKRIRLVLSILLFSLLISSLVTFFFTTPKYEISTQILVNQAQSNNETITSQELQSSREIINTYNVIMTSPAILEPVINDTNFEGSVDDLRSKIDVSSEENSQVVTLTVNDSSAQKAAELANALAQTFEDQVPDIMNVDNVSILSNAQITEDTNPVAPNPLLNLFAAVLIGLVASLVLVFLLEMLDKSIKTETDIEKELQIPVLGTVPIMFERDTEKSLNAEKQNTSLRGNERKSRKTS